jgi:hypothetical protein
VNVYDDVFGRIFLNSLDPQDVWYKVLNAVDMDLVYDRCAGHRRTTRAVLAMSDDSPDTSNVFFLSGAGSDTSSG